MTLCRIRAGRDSAITGAFDWAILDDNRTVLDSGSAPLRPPPAKSECELLLASELVLLEEITVSAAQQRRLSSSLRFLVEDMAISDPERLHVAAVRGAGKDILHVGIVDRQWMEQMLGRLGRSGVTVRAAYPECLLPDLPARGWTVAWNGAQSFARTGEFQGFVLDLAAEGEVPVALRLALDEARARASAPERIVVRIAAGAAAPALERWAAALGIPVEPGPAWHWAGARHRPGLNLLQAEFAPRTSEIAWTRALRRPALLAGALVIVTLSGVTIDWTMKVRERDTLTAQMQQVFRNVAGESAAVVDAPLQMRRALAQLRRQAGQIGADDFLALLGAVAGQTLDPAKFRVDGIVYGNSTLTLSVRPVDASQFSTLLGELRRKSSIPGLDIRLEPVESTGTISLRVAQRPGVEK